MLSSFVKTALGRKTVSPLASRSFAVGPKPVTVFRGDGIGPEIMDATLRVLDAAKAPLVYDFQECGEKIYLKGEMSGIDKAAWESIDRTKLLLKAPLTTPLGTGYKSVNVTLRKTLGLYSNVRPVNSYHPFIKSNSPNMDVVIVRENEEDLYAGIEHRHTSEVFQCLKLVTTPGIIRICRYAFEYAVRNGRKKVTCVTKNNIMKVTDGEFARIFFEVAKSYPSIKAQHAIVDIATARLAVKPEIYDVIVTLNLYGDIMSDVAAEVAGSVGCAASANIGDKYAMFEAVHGSAPDIAGQGIANPSALINASVLMLMHVHEPQIARTIKNAWLKTVEDGFYTADMPGDDALLKDKKRTKVGTKAFADAVIERLGKEPSTLKAVPPVAAKTNKDDPVKAPEFVIPQKPIDYPAEKKLVGIDMFFDWDESGRDANVLAKKIGDIGVKHGLKLTMISNRGVKVWPGGHEATYKVNHWRCRFMGDQDYGKKLAMMMDFHKANLEVIKTENLYDFDGKPGYSLGQGQ